MQEEIELREYWNLIRKRWKMVIAIPLIAVVASALVSLFVLHKKYEESTTLLVSNTQSSQGQSVQYQDILANQALVHTYSDIVKSQTVESQVIVDLHLSLNVAQLDSMIKVTSPNSSEVIQLSVTNENPQLAADIANDLATVFKSKAQSIMQADNVQVIDKAVVPAKPVAISPNKKLNVAIAFILGLMASIGLAFLMEYLDYRVRTEEDVRKHLGLPVIGVVGDFTHE